MNFLVRIHAHVHAHVHIHISHAHFFFSVLMGCHVTCQVMPFPKIFTTNIALEPVTLTFFLITTNQEDKSLGV
jgi:hypothetical protein